MLMEFLSFRPWLVAKEGSHVANKHAAVLSFFFLSLPVPGNLFRPLRLLMSCSQSVGAAAFANGGGRFVAGSRALNETAEHPLPDATPQHVSAR